jgi:hypothetical protein
MAIEQVPVRARISGDGFSVETPYIMSFNVSKNRGSPSTFSASIKIKSEYIDDMNGNIVVYAGVKGSMSKIFTGIIKKATITPCWDDPSYVIVNLNGVDVLIKLENRRITRRQPLSKTSWVSIDQASPGLRSGKLKFNKDPILIPSAGELVSSESNSVNTEKSTVMNADQAISKKSIEKKEEDVKLDVTLLS